MTTVKANRPLFYQGQKYKKDDTFELVENDGVLWGKDAISIVKIDEDEEPPEFVKPPKAKRKSPDTMSEMMKEENKAREKVSKAKGASVWER